MQAPPRALCITDLATVGRAGLSATLPALAACGVQACGLPTALYSTHTGGFGTSQVQDTALQAAECLIHYQREAVSFGAVHVGYLHGAHQFALARQAFNAWPEALRILDPALADNGRLYSGLTDGDVAGMQTLWRQAGLVTPNLTESALLLGLAPEERAPAFEEIEARLRALAAPGCRAVITGVPAAEETLCVCFLDEAGKMCVHTGQRVPAAYPGTGDLFCAALAGLLLRGAALGSAVAAASEFVEDAVRATFAGGGEERQGVWFEPLLHRLAKTAVALAPAL